jgi:hypothetical protein
MVPVVHAQDGGCYVVDRRVFIYPAEPVGQAVAPSHHDLYKKCKIGFCYRFVVYVEETSS